MNYGIFRKSLKLKSETKTHRYTDMLTKTSGGALRRGDG